MGAIFWVVVGAMTGYVCSKLVYKDATGLMRDVLVGVLGGLVGGTVYHRLGYTGPRGVTAGSIMIAVACAIILLILYRIAGRRRDARAA
jgi:uncharacterized membrane protein YeaQ/YmgE (transglycosylase-associated protein family)